MRSPSERDVLRQPVRRRSWDFGIRSPSSYWDVEIFVDCSRCNTHLISGTCPEKGLDIAIGDLCNTLHVSTSGRISVA